MERYPLIDNARFILIFFVVFGHMIEPIISTDSVIKTIYLSIYSFHIPAFIVLSGMLSKCDIKQEEILKIVKSILLPFIIFTLFYELFNYRTTGAISSYSKNIQPYWLLWFLYSLFIWKLLLPFVLRFRFPLIISLFIAIGAGYFKSIGYFLGLSRTLYFFPFFIIGYKFTSKALMEMKSKYNSPLYLLIFSGVIVFNITLFSIFSDMQHQWLYGSYSYSRLGAEGVTAGGTRLLLFFVSLSTVFSILMLIPNRRSKILSKGKNSLQVYVWHGFFIKFTGAAIISAVGNYPVSISMPVLFCTSALLTLILSHDFIAEKTQRLIISPAQSLILNNKLTKTCTRRKSRKGVRNAL